MCTAVWWLLGTGVMPSRGLTMPSTVGVTAGPQYTPSHKIVKACLEPRDQHEKRTAVAVKGRGSSRGIWYFLPPC